MYFLKGLTKEDLPYKTALQFERDVTDVVKDLNWLAKLMMNITIHFRFSMDIRFTSKWVIFFCKRLESFKYNGGSTQEELPYKTALQFERKAGATSTPLSRGDR
jgi:hypothetical protein